MSTQDTGGPAFPSGLIDPSTPEDAVQPIYPGMTLRDYFAAKVLSSMLAPNPVTGQFAQVAEFEYCADNAYKMADAMLKARAA
jgi:hypothetical protein